MKSQMRQLMCNFQLTQMLSYYEYEEIIVLVIASSCKLSITIKKQTEKKMHKV